MKYYSEEVVKKIITDATDAMRCGMEISRNVPISSNRYPSIEIPDKHGDIKDTKDILDRLAIKPTHDAVSTLLSIQAAVDESPTIIEASKEIEADDRT